MDTQSRSLAVVRQHLIARGFDVEFKNYIQTPTGSGIIKLSKPRLRVGKAQTPVSVCVFANISCKDGNVRVRDEDWRMGAAWDVTIPLSDPELLDKVDGIIDILYKITESTLANKRAKHSYFRRKSPF